MTIDEMSDPRLEDYARQPLNTLRIIYFALASGVVVFAVVILAVSDVEIPAGGNFFADLPVPCWLPFALLLPPLSTMTFISANMQKQVASQAQGRPPHEFLDAAAGSWQALEIIRAALWEGAAFCGVIFCMTFQRPEPLIASAVALAAMLFNFPTFDRFSRWVRGAIELGEFGPT